MKIVNKKLNLEEFKKYIKGKNFQPNNPYRLVIHHTWKPTEKDWNGQKTIDGLKKYYESLGWTSAPHLFVAPDGIWLFTDMKYQGTHAGEGNYRSIGIEVVGNYDGAKWSGKIKEQAIGVIKALMDELKIKDENLCFHRDFSYKTCPGSAIKKEWILEKIKAPVSPPKTEEAITPIPEPQTPVTEHPVASESILQDEPDLQTHPIEVNTNLNIWEKLLSLLKELASVIQNWKR
jgi:N-acetylmuramoyl-L-alanine amidase CwlA